MLRIGIEATGMITATQTGVQRYATCFIKALCQQLSERADYSLTLYTHSGNPRADRQMMLDSLHELPRARFHDWPYRRGYRAALSLFSKMDRIQVFHFPEPAWMHLPTCPVIVTIHDLCWRKLPGEIGAGEQKTMQAIGKALDLASAYIAVSNCTAEDLRELVKELALPERPTWVTYEGASPIYRPTPQEAEQMRERYQLGRYILCVSTYQRRKNLPALIHAFERLVQDEKQDLHLALVGSKGWGHADVVQAAETSPAAGRIHLLNYVPETDLPGLYSGAELFVYPSLYEGFGLPVLEAMSCGTPVVVSNCSSIPEIAQDAAIYFDPEREDEMTAAMLRVLADPAQRQAMRARGLQMAQQFSWQKTAGASLAAYQGLVMKERGQ